MAKRGKSKMKDMMGDLKKVANDAPAPTSVPPTRPGPKNKYDELRILDRLGEIADMYKEYVTDVGVASRLGVSVRTLYNWCDRARGFGFEDNAIEAEFSAITGQGYIPETPEKYKPFADIRNEAKNRIGERLVSIALLKAFGEYQYEKVAVTWVDGNPKEYRYLETEKANDRMIQILTPIYNEEFRETKNIHVTGGMNNTTRLLGDYTDAELEALKGVAESAVQGGITPALIEDDDYISRDDDEDGDEDA